MTPNGQAGTQYPQPLQMSPCTTTVPNSVRNSAPVGQTSRQPACVQCLQTSDDISQRISRSPLVAVCGSNSLVASALSTPLACALAMLLGSAVAAAGEGPLCCRD